MKRILTGLLSCALIFTLAACGAEGNNDSTATNEETTKESTTEESTTEESTLEETTTIESIEETTEADTASDLDASEDLSGPSTDTLVLLQSIWDGMPEDQQFPAVGGDVENSVMGGPGHFDFTKTEELCNILLFPEEHSSSILEAASLTHMMNTNNFTSALYLLDDGADFDSISKAYEGILETNHWLCGFPEEYLVLQLDDAHVFIAYGFSDNIANMKAQLSSLFESAHVLAEGQIV